MSCPELLPEVLHHFLSILCPAMAAIENIQKLIVVLYLFYMMVKKKNAYYKPDCMSEHYLGRYGPSISVLLVV